MLNNNSLKLFLKIFDVQIQPIVQYGSEIWGLDIKVAKQCESVHLLGLKKFLGVDRRTPNDLVYGDTDRYPIYINSAIRCIRYWLRLLKMDTNRLPRKAYNMLHILDRRGKINWVSNIRVCLSENGFGYAWMSQGVGDENMFVRVFRQRLIDCRWQEWKSHIDVSDRFDMYRLYSSSHLIKKYLLLNIDRHFCRLVTKFRFGISEINSHAFRYKRAKYPESVLLCPMCKESKEDDVHFVLNCPALVSLRKKLIPKKYYTMPCLFRLSLLMNSQHDNTVRNFAFYLYKAFQLRENFVT